MPRAYKKIRDKLKREGKSSRQAKTSAARIYNAKRGNRKPVTGKHK